MLGSDYFAISLFVCSLLFLLFVSHKKGIQALSLYWIFISFQCLSCLTPWLANQVGGQSFALLEDARVINIQLLLACSANICFGIIFLLFYKDVAFMPPHRISSARKRRNFVLLATPVFFVTSLLCIKYGWHVFAAGTAAGQAPTGMFSVTIDAKFVCIGIYLYYLYRFGLDKWAWVLFAEHVVILLLDNSRVTFLPIALVTFILYSSAYPLQRKKVLLLAVLTVIISVAVRAILVPQGTDIITNLMLSIMTEGTMGAYSSLQSINAIRNHLNVGYLWVSPYLVDPLLWFFPHGELRETLQSFGPWTSQIADDFSPWGGFYYISEAVAAFSYYGPAIVTSIFAYTVVRVERAKNRHRILYLTFATTIGILFVQTIFAAIFKQFIIELIIVGSICGIRSLLAPLASRHHKEPARQSIIQI